MRVVWAAAALADLDDILGHTRQHFPSSVVPLERRVRATVDRIALWPENARRLDEREGVRVSIAIFDQFGEPVYMYRMDGQVRIAIETAIMKARTALNNRRPSKAEMNSVLQGRSSEMRQYLFGNFANSGGLPIVINGNQMIGAIGVGGSAPNPPEWSDEICAWRALTEVMGPQPPLLPDLPRNAGE